MQARWWLSAVSAVHDGYVLQKSITRSPLGGSLLTKCMLKAAESILAEKSFTIRPRYSIKRVERQPGVFEVWHPVNTAPCKDLMWLGCSERHQGCSLRCLTMLSSSGHCNLNMQLVCSSMPVIVVSPRHTKGSSTRWRDSADGQSA